MITLIALLRLIPYAFIGVNAYTKGYRWLTAYVVYIFCLVIFVATVHPNESLRAVLASISVIPLLKHTMELPNKKGK